MLNQRASKSRPALATALNPKNRRERFLTSRSDGPKGGRQGWQATKKNMERHGASLYFLFGQCVHARFPLACRQGTNCTIFPKIFE